MMKRAGVLGSPIAHSLSPVLHRAAYRALDLDWAYDAYEVTEWELPAFVAELDGTWAGLSLTMPLKSCVIPLLDSVDEVAAMVTSVNTVLPREGGWHGTNTDIDGIVAAVRPHLDRTPAVATVIGTGATARSVIAALGRLGIGRARVVGRRPEAVESILGLAEQLGIEAQGAEYAPGPDLLGSELVVSTLPGAEGGAWAPHAGRATGVLLDVSYHPWPSPLARAWPGERIASGRDMLLWQAVEQVRLMTGREAPVAAMEAALRLEG